MSDSDIQEFIGNLHRLNEEGHLAEDFHLIEMSERILDIAWLPYNKTLDHLTKLFQASVEQTESDNPESSIRKA